MGFKLGIRTGTLGGMWVGSELINIFENWEELMTKPIDFNQSEPTQEAVATQVHQDQPTVAVSLASNTPEPAAPEATETPAAALPSHTPTPAAAATETIAATATQMVGQVETFIQNFDLTPDKPYDGEMIMGFVAEFNKLVADSDLKAEAINSGILKEVVGKDGWFYWALDQNKDGIIDALITNRFQGTILVRTGLIHLE